jgi:outer membrane protein assembly factor BamB
MPAIPASAFSELLREQDHDAIVAFVADLWAASGWDTATEGAVVTARGQSTTQRLLVLPPTWLSRLRSVPAFEGPVDLVVTPRESAGALPRGTPSVPVVAAADLRNRLLYALDTETGETLAQRHLGVSPRGEQWRPEDPLVVRLGETAADAAAPIERHVSRRAALGVLGVSALGGSAWLLAGRDGTTADGGSPDADGTPTDGGADDTDGRFANTASGDPTQVNASFGFEPGDGLVTISHEGGDPIPAGELLIRSEGLDVEREVAWSEVSTRDADAEIVEGDALSLVAAETYEITLLVERDRGNQQLAEFSHEPDPDSGGAGEGGSTGPPIASFSFEHDLERQQLTVTHDSGDRIEASELYVQGADFSGSPGLKWSEFTGFDGTHVEPGVSVTLVDAGEDVVVRVVWEGEVYEPTRVLEVYTGPGRPLDGSLGNVPNDRYGPGNTGHAPGGAGPEPAADSLRESWRFDRSGIFGPSIAVVDGRIFVVVLNGPVYAVDAGDGTELWRFTTDNRAGPMPMVVGETVFLGSVATADPVNQRISGVLALDVTDGSQRWGTELFRQRPSQIAATPETVYVPGSAFEGTGGGIVHALDTTTHRSRWTARLDRFSGSIAVGTNTVYVTPGPSVVALDDSDGSERWRFDPEGLSGRAAQPMVVEGIDSIVAVQRSGMGSDAGFRIHALERADGTVRWERHVDRAIAPPQGIIATAAAVGNGRLYLGTDRGIVTLNTTDGTVLWEDEDGPRVWTLTATDDTIYVADTNGDVHLRSPDDGTNLGTMRTDLERIWSLVAIDDRLFASGDALLAFETADGGSQ